HPVPGGPMPSAPHPSRFRLPADVRPTGYDLHLEPDLEGGAFRGEVRIALRLARPRAEIVLHAADLAIERATAHSAGREMSARVRLARADETAVSNGPVEREEPVPGGRVVRFAETPPLSTYLLALAVGRLEASAPRHLGPVPIRVWHVPGKGQLTAFALEAAAEALARLQDYFDIPYPYRKLDLVAVPDFEAGAMENAGAVFFRETLLLLDPATASLVERKRAAEVIAHELAHMWYGDLVTMAWWDDLWLNEAFATWMAYRVVADWRP